MRLRLEPTRGISEDLKIAEFIRSNPNIPEVQIKIYFCITGIFKEPNKYRNFRTKKIHKKVTEPKPKTNISIRTDTV